MPKQSSPDPLLALASVSPQSLKAKRCLVVRTLEAFPDRVETLRFLIDESGHTSPRIAHAAASAGIHISPEAIQKHRKASCQCLAS